MNDHEDIGYNEEDRPNTDGPGGPTAGQNWLVRNAGDEVTVRDSGGQTVAFDEESAEKMALAVLRSLNGSSILLEAYTTGQERGRQYGPPNENFDAAARLKSAYLGTDMDGFDYAIEMILTKVARLKTGGRDRDTLVDIAGYARAAAVYEGINDGPLGPGGDK